MNNLKKITVSGIRVEHRCDGFSYLVADIDFEGFDAPYDEKSMWFSVERKDEGMLEDRSYDSFFLVPLYLAMYHGAKLHIKGVVSRTLYRNMHDYGQQILCNFSPDLSKVDVEVEGYETLTLGSNRLVGTGISCGVDSLSTIYDRFAKEEDPEYRINSLFLFNCGTHGDFEDEKTRGIFNARYRRNAEAARDLGLPIHLVNSNLHAFTHKIGEQKIGFFAIYSCALAAQRAIRKYYTSSAYSYEEILRYWMQSRDYDMAAYCESYLVPLIQTESFELVLDGSQYRRSEKVQNIADWDIAKKYLNVCINPEEDGRNCSVCSKCKRTLIDLEALGKTQEYERVFDIKKYAKIADEYKSELVWHYGSDGMTSGNVDFAKAMGLPLPSKFKAFARLAIRKIKR